MGSSIIGKHLLDQFRVDEFIASGGMGSVYKVWDLKRNVPLAMKVLHTDLAEDPSMFKRFQREARALQKLSHPNIVPFYGLYQTLDFSFLVEKYIQGPNLNQILKLYRGTSLPLEEVLIYFKALSAALGYSHAFGVVHCDVKPGNVMIDVGGNIYLADFGIARHAESTTTTFGMAGTPAYMAPEQIRGESVTAMTDIYALGVMLFEMVTGQRPFRGNEAETEELGSTMGERIRYAHLNLSPPDPCELNPALPPQISRIIAKAMAKDPRNRYQSTHELFVSICEALSVLPDQVPARVSLPPSLIPEETGRLNTVERDSVVEVDANIPPVASKRLSSFYGKTGWILTGGIAMVLFVAFAVFPTIKKSQSNSNDALENELVQEATQLSQTSTLAPSRTPQPTRTATITVTPLPTKTLIPLQTNPRDNAALIEIPAGEFTMGSNPKNDPYYWGAEAPEHKVYLDAFWIYQTEVTNQMFQKCVEEKACPIPAYNKSLTRPSYYDNFDYKNYPVIYVTWTAAQAYCKWAGGRLPTEAEWEKAARGTDKRLFSWGNQPPQGNLVNYCDVNCPDEYLDRSQDDGYRDTAPVGSFPDGMSPYGVLDMSGNVSEWVFDWFEPLYYEISPENNPVGPASATKRVTRGGSYYNPDEGIRTVARYPRRPGETMETMGTVGFRCVVENLETQE